MYLVEARDILASEPASMGATDLKAGPSHVGCCKCSWFFVCTLVGYLGMKEMNDQVFYTSRSAGLASGLTCSGAIIFVCMIHSSIFILRLLARFSVGIIFPLLSVEGLQWLV